MTTARPERIGANKRGFSIREAFSVSQPPPQRKAMQANVHTPERLPNETREAYKARRAASKEQVNAVKRGTLIWDSLRKGTRHGSF